MTAVADELAGRDVVLEPGTALALARAKLDMAALLSMAYADVLAIPGIGPARAAYLRVTLARAGYDWPVPSLADAGLGERDRRAIARYLRRYGGHA